MREALSKGWSLKPYDAIHLATAARLRVARFHTYEEGKLDKYGLLIGCTVQKPFAPQLSLYPPSASQRDT